MRDIPESIILGEDKRLLLSTVVCYDRVFYVALNWGKVIWLITKFNVQGLGVIIAKLVLCVFDEIIVSRDIVFLFYFCMLIDFWVIACTSERRYICCW